MKVQEPLKTKVLKHLQRHGSITGLYFAQKYGSTRLSRYIEVLRKAGHDINTVEIVPKKKYKYTLNS